MAGVPGDSFSEPDVYSRDRVEELGDTSKGDGCRCCFGIDSGSLGIGLLG